MSTTKKKVAFGTSAGIAAVVAVMLGGLYDREGGYVNHKADRGGETNHGVTKVVARKEGYSGDMRVFPKHCETEKDVCADKIYYKTYIEEPGFIPYIQASNAIGDEIFDTGVNMGPYYASVFLQRSINQICPQFKIKVDGRLGNGTLTAFNKCQATIEKVKFCTAMVDALDAHQKARYDAIVKANPSQRVFYKGWINHRIGNVNRKLCAA